MSDIGKVWIFSCIIFVSSKTYSSIGISHDTSSLTWLEASNRCGNDGLEFRESILNKTDVIKGKLFWLGKAIYRKTSTWMEILGCYNVKDVTGITTLTGILSLAECQIKCLSISPFYFGYKKTTFLCICSENIPTVKTNFNYCENNIYLDAYFFYKEYREHVLPGLGGLRGNCTILRCSGGQNNIRAENCANEDNNIAGRCGNAAPNRQLKWGKTFFESLHMCMGDNLLLLAPSEYCAINGHRDQGITFWTNVFREDFELQLTKAEVENEIPLQCLAGQLVHLDGQWTINETKRDCNQGLHGYLCKNAESQSTTSTSTKYVLSTSLVTIKRPSSTTLYSAESQSTTSTSTKYVPSTSLVTIKRPSSTTLYSGFTFRTKETESKTSSVRVTQIQESDMNTLPRINTYIIRSTIERIPSSVPSSASQGVTKNSTKLKHQTDNSEQRSSNSNTIGAVIGGLLGVCCIIALLAVLIVCKKRSIGVFKDSIKQHKQETSQMEFSETTYKDSNNTRNERNTIPASNETYGLAENSTSVYAVVNKSKKPGNTDETYNDAVYGEYDHLHDIQDRRISPQENLYHSHGAPKNEDDQTYDSSDFGKRKYYDGNGVYDQSFSVVEEESVYITNQNHNNINNMGIYDKAS